MRGQEEGEETEETDQWSRQERDKMRVLHSRERGTVKDYYLLERRLEASRWRKTKIRQIKAHPWLLPTTPSAIYRELRRHSDEVSRSRHAAGSGNWDGLTVHIRVVRSHETKKDAILLLEKRKPRPPG